LNSKNALFSLLQILISSDVRMVATQGSSANGADENPNQMPTANGNSSYANGSGEEEEDDKKKLDWKRPLLLMIPLRLGLTAINPCYLGAVIEFFKLPQCVGILGGRPRHAVYFYGAAGQRVSRE
jgi:hypothetical protein